jgi:phenylpyruvate tautomerase PptA (4-oxalocrotonate tautomerase family)
MSEASANRTVRLHVDPGSTPEEEAALVARVAAAIAESTGSDEVVVELHRGQELVVGGSAVAERIQGSQRWSA